MRRLRESWLALGGATLIVALSISSAIGGNTPRGPGSFGAQVADLAHTLTFGQPDASADPSDDQTTGEATEPDAEAQTDDATEELSPDESDSDEEASEEEDASEDGPQPGDEDYE